ncbi:hypothetical protein [Endozoicomonas atrinae]|uniref:hypothetical protein n=1 Tax=Endozoicomonas atrinae TaxID=1333660 RepID=UPI003AFF96F3
MPFPFDIPDNEKSELISKILKYTTRTQEENAQLKERVNILEQEIHRLKGLNGKPDIKPNTPKNDDSSSKPGDDNDAGAGHQKREALFEFQTAELSFAEKISHCQHRP